MFFARKTFYRLSVNIGTSTGLLKKEALFYRQKTYRQWTTIYRTFQIDYLKLIKVFYRVGSFEGLPLTEVL